MEGSSITTTAGQGAIGVVSPIPVFEFVAPTNSAVFSTLQEIPIVLRAHIPGDLIPFADVFANQENIGRAAQCCPFCPCARPMPGQETILQIPAPWDEGAPPSTIWQGWTNAPAGIHRLTARGMSENGTAFDTAPVTITVLDLTLQIAAVSPEGVTLVIPHGSMAPGRYDLESSENLVTWTRLGPFQPGAVAAFYVDHPPGHPRRQRYYRSVYSPFTPP